MRRTPPWSSSVATPPVSRWTTPSFHAIVTARSMRAASVVIPRCSRPFAAANSSAAWMTAFDGMQPTFRHVPPISARSTITTLSPSCAARSAQT